MKFIYLAAFIFIISSNLRAQEADSTAQKDPNWKAKSTFGLNMTQSSFTNWNAGGRNNISGLAFINAQANYKKDEIRWANMLSLGLGGIQYFDEGLQKTDDVIDLQSSFSYGLKDPWFLSALAGFRTQFLDGFSNAEDTVRASTFMAPGYGNISLGIEYEPNDNFKVMASPVSGKFTFVQDDVLSAAGAFGVEPGETFRPEIGSYIRVVYSKEIMENIDLRTRWEFFSNYLENPQNIDVNAELVVNFKVNKWFSATLQANLIYDDDIDITDRFDNTGPRTQFKQVIGVGIAYRLANFKEKKKE